jgi:hypothetical protein
MKNLCKNIHRSFVGISTDEVTKILDSSSFMMNISAWR